MKYNQPQVLYHVHKRDCYRTSNVEHTGQLPGHSRRSEEPGGTGRSHSEHRHIILRRHHH